MSKWDCEDAGAMKDAREIAEEVIEALDQDEYILAAEELEAVARIIRAKACGGCQSCSSPFCRQPRPLPTLFRN